MEQEVTQPAGSPGRGLECLVLGGTGFVGRPVVQALCRAGYAVTVYARQSSDTWGVRQAGAKVVRGDLRDIPRLRTALAGQKLVFHLGDIRLSDPQYLSKTSEGLEAIIETARQAKDFRRVIFASAINTVCHPVSLTVDEQTPMAEPLNDRYTRQKRASEQQLLAGPAPVTILRLGWPYGRDNEAILNLVRWMIRLHPLGVPFAGTRAMYVPTIHTDDVARAMLLAAAQDEPPKQVYHAVDDGRQSYADFFEMLGERLQRKLRLLYLPRRLQYFAAAIADRSGLFGAGPVFRPYVDFFSRRYVFCNEKIKRELGLQFKYPTIAQGFDDLAEWLKAFCPPGRNLRRPAGVE